MELRHSQTWKNLQAAFAGETKASTKYRIYALKARKDGFEQMGDIFEETARNEQEHAEIWMKALTGGEVPPTAINLRESAAGERYEWTQLYSDFSITARKEGFVALADLFCRVGNIEKQHEKRYNDLARNVNEKQVFCKENRCTVWICKVCGNFTYAQCSPALCPVCGHTKSFTEMKADNY